MPNYGHTIKAGAPEHETTEREQRINGTPVHKKDDPTDITNF